MGAVTGRINDPVLVIVDHEGASTLAPASNKTVRMARDLTDGPLYALSLTATPDTDSLGAAGADVVLVAQAEGFSPRVPAAVTDAALAAVARIQDPGAVLCTSSYRGRAVAAMLATRLDSGSAVDVSEIGIEDGTLVAHKTALAGAWSTKFRVTSGVPILAIRSGAGLSDEVREGEAVVSLLPFELSPAARAVEVVETTPIEAGARIGLNEADVAVVGGRGVDGNFEMVEELADELGGAVGATRVACDEGWVTRSAQIGQTGVSIAPKLYIGLGVSGAVHHTCGMLASEKIVAVVDDPDAPIVELADFSVIGDVKEVVPQALAALRNAAEQG